MHSFAQLDTKSTPVICAPRKRVLFTVVNFGSATHYTSNLLNTVFCIRPVCRGRPAFQSVTMYLLYHDSVYLDSSNCMTADHEDPEETEAVPSSLGEDAPSECDEQTLPVRELPCLVPDGTCCWVITNIQKGADLIDG